MRIDMADFDNATAFASYSNFSVGRDSVNPEEDGYPLTVDGYSGTAGKAQHHCMMYWLTELPPASLRLLQVILS